MKKAYKRLIIGLLIALPCAWIVHWLFLQSPLHHSLDGFQPGISVGTGLGMGIFGGLGLFGLGVALSRPICIIFDWMEK